ncbi:MAG: hypothetical protein ABI696_07215 [Rubrivivax sp.]
MLLPGAPVFAQAAAPASAASAAGIVVRPEIAPALEAARVALQAQQYDEALRQLGLADAVADKTPVERYLLERMRAAAALGKQDGPATLKAIDAALATDQADPALKLQLLEQGTVTAYNLKDHDAVVRWTQRFLDAGGSSAAAKLRMAQSQYLLGRHAEAAKLLDDVAAQQRAAGEKPSEVQLRLQVVNLQKAGNDDAAMTRALDALLSAYPKPEIWTERLLRLARKPGFDDKLMPDLLRLGVAADAWPDGSGYADLADRALRGGFAAEAKQVTDTGYTRGKLGQGPKAAEHASLRQQADAAAAKDRPELPDPKTISTREPRIVFATGWNLFTAGKTTEGLALMEQAVPRASAEQANEWKLRLGSAYATAGNAAKAREWLQPLAAAPGDGDAATLARLWLLRAGG